MCRAGFRAADLGIYPELVSVSWQSVSTARRMLIVYNILFSLFHQGWWLDSNLVLLIVLLMLQGFSLGTLVFSLSPKTLNVG